jgi:hypothetical protein
MNANEITTTAQFSEVARVLWFTPTPNGWGIPAVLKSQPGTAKTSLIRATAHSLGLAHVFSVNFGEVGEAFAGCMPAIDAVENTVSYPAPSWVGPFQDAPRGMLFLDEITTDHRDLRAAAMNLILERQVSGHSLGIGSRVMGACNPEGMGGCNVRDFQPAEANRQVHLLFAGPSRADGADHMRTRDVFATMGGAKPAETLCAATEESRVRDAWGPAYARAVMLVWDGFLRANPELLHAMPAEHDPASSGAWPSRRTWDMATLLLASCEIQGASESTRDLLLAGTVGDGAAVALAAYLNNLDLVDPSALLDGVATWEHDPKRPDRTWVTLAACARVATGDETSPERVKALWAILRQTSAHGSDFIIDAVSALIKAKQYSKRDPNAAHCTKILAPMLRAAGLA